jgi:hypothetical protein
VRLGDDLYIRAYKGRNSPWFRGVQSRHEGQIRAGGVVKVVTFVEDDEPRINDQIDNVYRTKYRRYAGSILNSMVTPEARAATIKLIPRS